MRGVLRQNMHFKADQRFIFSFNYNQQEVQMRWSNKEPAPVTTMAPIVLPDFDLIKIKPTWVTEVNVQLSTI